MARVAKKALSILIVVAAAWFTAPGARAQTATAVFPMFDFRTYSQTIPGVLIYGFGLNYDVTLSLRVYFSEYEHRLLRP